MVTLLTNRSFQVWAGGLAIVGALCALMATGTVDTAIGLPATFTVAGYVLGVPVSAGELPTPTPVPVPTPPVPVAAPVPAVATPGAA